ncbi:MAG: DUF2007 domain-containing protein [Atribacterota bacterium]|nr:DUF2007 domain-containing protein [Atribacterota bacterium]
MENNNGYRESKIIELCRVPTEVDALPIQSLLESYGIKCILQSHVTRSVHPFTVDGLAEVRILIAEKDLAKAKDVLKGGDCF